VDGEMVDTTDLEIWALGWKLPKWMPLNSVKPVKWQYRAKSGNWNV